MASDSPPTGGRRATRGVPPLVMTATVVSVLALILPSALRVPPQDPTPVLEFAPVPPQDDAPQSNEGNVSSLSLGSSSTLSETIEGTKDKVEGEGEKLLVNDCIRHPDGILRQTEDPQSPPCVPYFDADNGGETWRGVTGDEIRVVLYMDRGGYASEPAPAEGIYDLDDVPSNACPKEVGSRADECAQVMMRMARALVTYFNTRFETYNRRVHLFVHWTSKSSVQGRRADAVEQLDTVAPFAAIDLALFGGNNEEYVDALASRGVLVFSSVISTHVAEFYQRNAPFAWGFWPDIEHWAKSYSTYVCTKVNGGTAIHARPPQGERDLHGIHNAPRKYGFFYTTDAGQPGLIHFRRLVKKQLAACGIQPAAEGSFPQSRFIINNNDPGTDQQAAVANFIDKGVTTVLYLGGVEGKFSTHAHARKYYPEIVLAGDLFNDNTSNARFQQQDVWRNAWAVSYQVREDRQEERFGYRAAKEGDPNLDEDAAGFAAEFYRDFFMLFQAIQVPGPELTPTKVDQGFHAIPARHSENPYIAACFFDPGDYSCVKDAMEIWWDPEGRRPNSNQPGCWRMVEGGQRYLAGTWKGDDGDVFAKKDPCQGRGGSYAYRLA